MNNRVQKVALLLGSRSVKAVGSMGKVLETGCKWHLRLWCGTGSHVTAVAAAGLTAVDDQDQCGTLRRASGVSSRNSSEAPSCCITSKRIKVIIRPCPQWVLAPVVLWQRFALSLVQVPGFSLWFLRQLSLSLECAQSTKVAKHSQVLWSQIYCQNSESQSLWGTWHLNKATKCLSLDNSACCIHILIILIVQGREGKLALTWSAKCSQAPNCRCSRGMKDLQFTGSLLGRSRRLSAFEQQICNYLLKLLPGDCSCCWPVWNRSLLAGLWWLENINFVTHENP